MSELTRQYFPIFFGLLWLTITTVLGLLSGWFSLMRKFPDRPETSILTLRGQSGSMGPMAVGFGGVLSLGVCSSGLRIGIFRVFGPFCRPFFVPWQEISIKRRSRLWGQTAELRFGIPVIGKLVIPSYVADRLGRTLPDSWPELEPPPPESRERIFRNLFKQWALTTAVASTFFTVAPRVMSHGGANPPIAVSILFPAVAFGIGAAIQYWRRVSKKKRRRYLLNDRT